MTGLAVDANRHNEKSILAAMVLRLPRHWYPFLQRRLVFQQADWPLGAGLLQIQRVLSIKPAGRDRDP